MFMVGLSAMFRGEGSGIAVIGLAGATNLGSFQAEGGWGQRTGRRGLLMTHVLVQLERCSKSRRAHRLWHETCGLLLLLR